VPAMNEYLPGYEASSWYGMGAPRATPPDIIGRLNKEINAGLDDRKLVARFAELGLTVLPGSSSEFRKFIGDETEKWSKVVRASGARAD
jgi:tripartite-type tricarboxylate transporter receptor subunit TctC